MGRCPAGSQFSMRRIKAWYLRVNPLIPMGIRSVLYKVNRCFHSFSSDRVTFEEVGNVFQLRDVVRLVATVLHEDDKGLVLEG